MRALAWEQAGARPEGARGQAGEQTCARVRADGVASGRCGVRGAPNVGACARTRERSRLKARTARGADERWRVEAATREGEVGAEARAWRREAVGVVCGTELEEEGEGRREGKKRKEKKKKKKGREREGKEGRGREIRAETGARSATCGAWARVSATRESREKHGAGYGCRVRSFGDWKIGTGRFPES